MPIITLHTITNVRMSIGKAIVCGYVTKQTCHHTSLFLFPLKFTEILVSHALLFRLQPALTAVCKLSWFSREHTRLFFKTDQTYGSFCKFVFVVHTERLSVHAALFYPCPVDDWDSTCRHICFQTAYTRCKLTNIMVGLTLHTFH